MTRHKDRVRELERLTAAKEALLTTGSKDLAEKAIGLSGLTYDQCMTGINARLTNAIAAYRAYKRIPRSLLDKAAAVLAEELFK